jgi:hypothetical protein
MRDRQRLQMPLTQLVRVGFATVAQTGTIQVDVPQPEA